MIDLISKICAALQIKLLIIFRPTVLFEKINNVDWYKRTLRQWVADQEFPAKSKVLEVGCATGALTSYIAKAGHALTGVDLSSEMIELANIKNHDIDYIVADALNLPFESNSFDVVIATSLVNIIDDKTKAINELVRTCKSGGIISIFVPLEGFNDNDLMLLQSSIGSTGFSAAAMDAWHKNAPKMNTNEINNLFMEAGVNQVVTKIYLQGMVVSASAIKSL